MKKNKSKKPHHNPLDTCSTHSNDTMTWQDFHFERHKYCVLPNLLELNWSSAVFGADSHSSEKNEHPLLSVAHGDMFFFRVYCIPNVLQHVWLPLVNTTAFSLPAHFTPPIQIYLNHSFQQLMEKESVYFCSSHFLGACPLHMSSRARRHISGQTGLKGWWQWSRAFSDGKLFYPECVNMTSVAFLLWVTFVHWIVTQSPNQSINQWVKGIHGLQHISYAA